jgi:hypothetical protein
MARPRSRRPSLAGTSLPSVLAEIYIIQSLWFEPNPTTKDVASRVTPRLDVMTLFVRVRASDSSRVHGSDPRLLLIRPKSPAQVAFTATLVFDTVAGAWMLFIGSIVGLLSAVLFPADHYLVAAKYKAFVGGSHAVGARRSHSSASAAHSHGRSVPHGTHCGLQPPARGHGRLRSGVPGLSAGRSCGCPVAPPAASSPPRRHGLHHSPRIVWSSCHPQRILHVRASRSRRWTAPSPRPVDRDAQVPLLFSLLCRSGSATGAPLALMHTHP